MNKLNNIIRVMISVKFCCRYRSVCNHVCSIRFFTR